jgi:hypothetical protein
MWTPLPLSSICAVSRLRFGSALDNPRRCPRLSPGCTPSVLLIAASAATCARIARIAACAVNPGCDDPRGKLHSVEDGAPLNRGCGVQAWVMLARSDCAKTNEIPPPDAEADAAGGCPVGTPRIFSIMLWHLVIAAANCLYVSD